MRVHILSHNNTTMDTPFGSFEPSVELDEFQTQTIMRSLEFLEAVRTSIDGSFTVDVEGDQPLIVKTIRRKRLELPVFEALELDAQRLYGYPPTNQVPLRIDGQPHNGVVIQGDRSLMLDAITSIMHIAINNDSCLPEGLRMALG